MYPRGPQVLEEDEEDDEQVEEEVEEEEEEGEVKEKPSTAEVKSAKAAVSLESSAGRKASEEECDVAEALATWKRRREERLER